MTEQDLPRNIWRAAHWGLGLIAASGIALATALVFGAADPPRAGTLQREVAGAFDLSLPMPPYTLETTGVIPSESDTPAWWGVNLGELSVMLNGDGFLRIAPAQPDFAPFIHVRRAGSVNQIRVDVAAGHWAVVRINDEIAWQGLIAPASTARTVILDSAASSDNPLRIIRGALYAP